MSRFTAIAMLLALAIGCSRGDQAGKSSQTVVPESGNKGVVLKPRDPALKWAKELTELDEKVASLPGTDLAADKQALLKWLQARPEYEAAGIAQIGNVWARFSDGRLVMIPFPVPGTRGSASSATKAVPALQSAPAASQTPLLFLPASRKACLLRAFAGGQRPLASPIDDLTTWLTTAGYEPLRHGARLADLRAVSGVGIFYIDTHGVMGVDRSGSVVYGILSEESAESKDGAVAPERLTELEEDLESGRLCECSMIGSSCFAVTQKFVKHYMSFADGAFVFVNACSSENDGSFRQAFFDKGAAVFAGWTGDVGDKTANIVSRFLFDRALGVNQYQGTDDYQAVLDEANEAQFKPEVPKQRPFSLAYVFGDMCARNYDVDRWSPEYHHVPRGAVAMASAPTGHTLSDSELAGLSTGGVPPDVTAKLRESVGRYYSISEFRNLLAKLLNERERLLFAPAIWSSFLAADADSRRVPSICRLQLHYGDVKIAHAVGLCPSIIRMHTEEMKDELVIIGAFGPDLARVTVGGEPVQVIDAKIQGPTGTLRCKLPRSGPGAAGDVIIAVDGRMSNPRPLTEWRIQVRYTGEDLDTKPPLKTSAVFDLHIRADIHSIRMMPHAAPQPQAKDAAGRASVTLVKDSKARWEFSGSGVDSLTGKTHFQLTGSGALLEAEQFPTADRPEQLLLRGSVDTQKRALVARLTCVAPETGVLTVTTSDDKQVRPHDFRIGPGNWVIHFDERFNVLAGKVTLEVNSLKEILEWDAAPANHAPTSNTISTAPLDGRKLYRAKLGFE